MDQEYDVIVLGTGLKECILSGLMSVEGKRVLHMDRNDYYGGESASLNISQLYQKFNRGGDPQSTLGHNRNWCVDLIPKFIMAEGLLVKTLIRCKVTHYLNFKSIMGSYVYKQGKIHKVPASNQEALKTKLVGFKEKRRFKKFLIFCQDIYWKVEKALALFDLDQVTMTDLFAEFRLQDSTQTFVGHAMALYREDSYLTRPAREAVDRINLYLNSISRYGNTPYIYPLYGLGDLPQAFARLSAIYGGTYMLNKKVEEIVYEDGHVVGVKANGEIAKCSTVIADPSYFPDKVKKVAQVVRCITLLNSSLKETNNAESFQIIIPQTEVNRNNDIYICCISHAHSVVPEGMWLATISTIVETDDPEAEIEPAFNLIPESKIVDKFFRVDDLFEPTNDATQDGCCITSSYDATTHFETTIQDVMNVYSQVTGTSLDLSKAIVEESEV